MSLTACAEIVERGDPDRFRAAMAAPPAARAVLFPLYAFNVEVARAPWVTEEPMIAEMRLQWWRDVLDEIAAGGPVRRHEVATPLSEVLDAEGAQLLDAGVAARRWDAYRDPFEDEDHLRDHIRATAAEPMWAAARALGATNPAPVRAMGEALGIANWLRAVPDLEARGRIPLVDGRAEGVRALAEAGLACLAAGRKDVGSVVKSARAALLPAFMAGRVLSRAAARPGDVIEGRLDPGPMRQSLMLLRAAATGRV